MSIDNQDKANITLEAITNYLQHLSTNNHTALYAINSHIIATDPEGHLECYGPVKTRPLLHQQCVNELNADPNINNGFTPLNVVHKYEEFDYEHHSCRYLESERIVQFLFQNVKDESDEALLKVDFQERQMATRPAIFINKDGVEVNRFKPLHWDQIHYELGKRLPDDQDSTLISERIAAHR